MRYCRWVLILSVFSAVLFSSGSRPAFSKDRFRQFALGNGIKVILEENRTTPVVTLQIWVKIGSADEKDEEAGMCHFIEHMLFKGTEKRKSREMAREIESLGGSINAYTSYDQTVYYINIATRYSDAGLDVLSDMLQHPTFDALELDREREVVLEEIRRGEDDPQKRLFYQTMSALYQRHPYRRPISGYERTVRSITRDQMVSFFKRGYVPNRMVFIASGDLDVDGMERKVKEVLGKINPSSEVLSERPSEPPQAGFRSVVSHGNFREAYLQIGLHIPSAKHEDAPALDALAAILGKGETSRLAQKVKLEKGLVHTVSASSLTPKDPGAFLIEASLSADDLERALTAIWEEVVRIEREGVTADELDRVKVNVESGAIYDRQTAQGRARKMGFYEVVAGDVQFENEYLRRMALLRTEDIQNVARNYFKASQLGISILVPSGKAELVGTLSFESIIEKSGEKIGEKIGSAEPLPEKKHEQENKRVLGNGIRLIVRENRTIPIVSIQASFLGGVRFEDEAQNGINQFIAVMLTKGTKKQTNLEIARTVERMGGSLSAFSGYNSFGLTFTFLSQHFEEAFGLFSEILREPSFDKEEMEKRRRLILASIHQQEDDLVRLVLKNFRKTLFGSSPYGMDTLGTPESIQSLTQKDLRDYFRKMVVAGNMVLTVVGDVDEKQVLHVAERWFGDLKTESYAYSSGVKEASPHGIRKGEVYKKKEQAHFVLGFLGAGLQDRDRYALEVLRAALSGQSGRLFRQLRDKESLAYALDFFAVMNLDTGFIGVYMGTQPGKLETAIRGVLRELKKVREEGLTKEEMERAKRYLIGHFEMGLQTYQAQANQISLDELYGLGFDHYRRYPLQIENVSMEDVQRVAKRYINLEAYSIAIIRPPG